MRNFLASSYEYVIFNDKFITYNYDFRFSHAGLVILPQKQNPDDLFLGPRNATVSPPSSAGAQPRRRISLYHDMKFTAVNEETAAAQDNKEEKTASSANNGPPGLNPNAPSFRCFTRSLRKVGTAASGLSLPPNVVRMPHGPDKSSGKGFAGRRKTSKTATEEIKEENEEEEECVASTSAEVEGKVRGMVILAFAVCIHK